MKKLISIALIIIATINCSAQANLGFERWIINYNGIDEAKHWLNTADASEYNAPATMFKEVEDPASGLASIKLTTAYWEIGADYQLDTLVGSLVQQREYTQRPQSFEFDYKADPKLGDEVLIGVQLSVTIGEELIVIGEGFFSTDEKQDSWISKKIDIKYYSSFTPENINIIAVSSANAVIRNGENGYAKIGSSLTLDNLRLNIENEQEIAAEYFIHVFPNPAKEFINLETNSPEEQRIEIYNLSSQLVLSSSFSTASKIDISELPSGTYIYKVSGIPSNKLTATNKFSVIR